MPDAAATAGTVSPVEKEHANTGLFSRARRWSQEGEQKKKKKAELSSCPLCDDCLLSGLNIYIILLGRLKKGRE